MPRKQSSASHDIGNDGAPQWKPMPESRNARWQEPLMWNWDSYRYFIVLARVGIMRRAAERLMVSVATLSRHIEQLETELGVCLFQRRPHGISLTPVGRQILQHCDGICNAFSTLADHVHGNDATLLQHVNLRIDSLLARALLPGLLPFVGANVGVSIDIAATRPSEWQTGDFDIAIGFTRPESGPLLIRKIADLRMSMAVGRALDERRKSHMLTLDFVDGSWRGSLEKQGGVTALRECHLENIVDLVIRGLGKAMLPDYVIESEPALEWFDTGGSASRIVLPIWLVIRETAGRSTAVRTVADLCSSEIRARFSAEPCKPIAYATPSPPAACEETL